MYINKLFLIGVKKHNYHGSLYIKELSTERERSIPLRNVYTRQDHIIMFANINKEYRNDKISQNTSTLLHNLQKFSKLERK